MAPQQYRTVDIDQKDSSSLRFLYNTAPGRCVLKALVNPVLSKMVGAVLDTKASKCLIKGFIKSNAINMADYAQEEYDSFNAFFTRHIREERRPFSENAADVLAPCDGKLTVYPITEDAVFHIKNTAYDIVSLLDDPVLAKAFAGGTCLIFRLSPDDYHRYCFTHNGEILLTRKIPGVLHTVRPIAFNRYPVFKQNAREYTVLETEGFGKVIQMEVGAMFVGRIKNHGGNPRFSRGDEKGMFEFGGSTVVMLYGKDAIDLDPVFRANTEAGKETIVTMGMKLGAAK